MQYTRAVLVIGLISAAGASPATADIVQVEFTTGISMIPGSGDNAEGLDGTTMHFSAQFDLSQVYQDNGVDIFPEFFSTPAIDGSASLRFEGGTNPAFGEEQTLDFNVAYFPAFAGFFNTFDFTQPSFTGGNGIPYIFGLNTTTAPGAVDAAPGGQVEFDDFVGIEDNNLFTQLQPSFFAPPGSGTFYNYVDPTFEVTLVPSPSAAAAIGFGGIAAVRRRRAG